MKSFVTILLIFLTAVSTNAANWSLYFYSETAGINGDAGTFAATGTNGVYTLTGVKVIAKGISFGVHDESWSTIYGWSNEGGTVSQTDTPCKLASSTVANAWLGLEPGVYDVTWNETAKTILFAKGTDSDDIAKDYLRGGDISMLTYVEDLGAKFYTSDGTQKDALDIMQDNGVNFVRLRLYNNPGNTISYSNQSYSLPSGYLDETDILRLAKRAKQHDMKIQLTFHYSDFWTNGEMQFKPKGWENLSKDDLQQAVYNYTKEFLEKMKAQNTPPEYVSLGNEIQGGLLFGHSSQINSVSGYASNDNMGNVAALLAAGSRAVRETCPDSKVIIHLTLSTGVTTSNYIWFFDHMKQHNLDYDIIGTSYYPYWTNQRPSMLNALANEMYERYNKDVMVMEVGYSWTQYLPQGRYGGNYEGQLHLNGTPYNEATRQGQKSFMKELQTTIKNNEHLLGYLYWDPVMVEQRVGTSWIKTGWVAGGSNVVGNTTWFDYEGKALPVFEAMAEDAGKATGITTIKNEPAATLNYYNLQGTNMGPDSGCLTAGIYIQNGKKFFIK